MSNVAKVAGLRAQIEFCEKLKRLMEFEAPRNHQGVPCRPFSLWISRLAKDIVDAEKWLAVMSR